MIGWANYDPQAMLDLVLVALTHDYDETITGDVPGPAKGVLQTEEARAYIEAKLRERLPHMWADFAAISERNSDELYAVLKVADKLDALLFLIGEKRFGNAALDQLIDKLTVQLLDAWSALPASSDVLVGLWNDEVLPSLMAHAREGSVGL